MSYICGPEILVTRFPREPEDIFGGAIYNYACQFSVIRSSLHALTRSCEKVSRASWFPNLSDFLTFSFRSPVDPMGGVTI